MEHIDRGEFAEKCWAADTADSWHCRSGPGGRLLYL